MHEACSAFPVLPVQVGEGLSKNTEREIVNHRKLLHPNIIRWAQPLSTAGSAFSQASRLLCRQGCLCIGLHMQSTVLTGHHKQGLSWSLPLFTCMFTCVFTCRFKEVFYTDDHLAIVMEYASEGHLSNRIKLNGRLAEDDARRHVPNAHRLEVHPLALCLQSILLRPQAARAACWMLLLPCAADVVCAEGTPCQLWG